MYRPCYNLRQCVRQSNRGRNFGGGNGLGDTSSIQSQIVADANAAGIPASIALAVAQIESSFNPSAVSPAGAVGVMQLMPGTASDLGVNPSDTSQNIQGGVDYLAQMYQKFGNWAQALAAYNAGPGNIGAGAGYAQSVLAAQPSYSSFDSVAAPVSADVSTAGVDFSSLLSAGDSTTPLLILGGVGLIALVLAFR
jgi:soluble lytic murein transglycosylase-like protein